MRQKNMEKQVATKPHRERKPRVKLDNPFFQEAYDQLEKDIRNVKKMSREEALAWIKRVAPSA